MPGDDAEDTIIIILVLAPDWISSNKARFVKLDFNWFILGHFRKGLLIVAACKFALVI